MRKSCDFSVVSPTLKGLTLAVAMALAGGATGAMAQEKVLRIAMTAGDIPRTSGQPDQGFEGNRFTGIPLYDALTNWDLSQTDKPSELIPGLALSWEVNPADKTKWTFKLRPGVKFHDGSDFNADAVVWNVQKVLDKEAEHFDPAQVGATASRMPTLRSAKKIDNLTVELTTSEPDSFLPINLTNLFMASPAHWGKKLAAVPASVTGKAKRHGLCLLQTQWDLAPSKPLALCPANVLRWSKIPPIGIPSVRPPSTKSYCSRCLKPTPALRRS